MVGAPNGQISFNSCWGEKFEPWPYDLNISKQSVVTNSQGDKKYHDSRQQHSQPEIIIFTKAGSNSCLFIRGLYLPAVTAVTLNKTSNASAAAWPENTVMAGISPSLLLWGGFCGQCCLSGALTELFFLLVPELGDSNNILPITYPFLKLWGVPVLLKM